MTKGFCSISLKVLGTDSIRNTASNYALHCCLRICRRRNVFIAPLPRNGQGNYVTIFT
jgi:hypothetical protein